MPRPGAICRGRLLPLYFTEPEFPPGRDPALIYVTALGLKVLPFSEAGVRTPTALVAVLNVVLTFFVARRLFQSTRDGAGGRGDAAVHARSISFAAGCC